MNLAWLRCIHDVRFVQSYAQRSVGPLRLKMELTTGSGSELARATSNDERWRGRLLQIR
jgi:hypothetical protein